MERHWHLGTSEDCGWSKRFGPVDWDDTDLNVYQENAVKLLPQLIVTKRTRKPLTQIQRLMLPWKRGRRWRQKRQGQRGRRIWWKRGWKHGRWQNEVISEENLDMMGKLMKMRKRAGEVEGGREWAGKVEGRREGGRDVREWAREVEGRRKGRREGGRAGEVEGGREKQMMKEIINTLNNLQNQNHLVLVALFVALVAGYQRVAVKWSPGFSPAQSQKWFPWQPAFFHFLYHWQCNLHYQPWELCSSKAIKVVNFSCKSLADMWIAMIGEWSVALIRL